MNDDIVMNCCGCYCGCYCGFFDVVGIGVIIIDRGFGIGIVESGCIGWMDGWMDG